MIHTRRLEIVPVPVEQLRTEVESPGRLASIVRLDGPAEWPPEFYEYDPIEYILHRIEQMPAEAPWWLYGFFLRDTAQLDSLIGAGGFKGPPTGGGTVEIGYAVLPEYRGRGLATEAAIGLVRFAFDHDDVARVIAETLPTHAASIRVLEKCRFRFIGEGSEDGIIRFELRRHEWADDPWPGSSTRRIA